MNSFNEHPRIPNFFDDLDHASETIDGRCPSYQEIEDQDRNARLDNFCEIDHDVLNRLARSGSGQRALTIVALSRIVSDCCVSPHVRSAVEDLIEAQEEDLGSGGPPIHYHRALRRHQELIKVAEHCLRQSPQTPHPDAVAMWAMARLRSDASWDALQVVYLNAVRLYRCARELYDVSIDLPDCPNEALRKLLDEKD